MVIVRIAPLGGTKKCQQVKQQHAKGVTQGLNIQVQLLFAEIVQMAPFFRHPNLLFGFLSNNPNMKSFAGCNLDPQPFGKVTLPFAILRNVSKLLSSPPANGDIANMHSYIVTPNAHQSTKWQWPRPVTISGAQYLGDPHTVYVLDITVKG
jgi:hypothetical protein